VPFPHVGERVEVRGCAETVQILKDCRVIATHRRHTAARLIIDPAHYEGPDTTRVLAPPPLGRMGAKIMELAPIRSARSSSTPPLPSRTMTAMRPKQPTTLSIACCRPSSPAARSGG
jgi:hypothetical protein